MPKSVEKYCLISAKDSYTDFHIDFSGTSVWYHVVKGKKEFYIIRPTEANMSLYWTWSESKDRLLTFFADQVDECYKCILSENMTLFLPTGWIHAVLTMDDSLVYGGNFLHSFSIPRHLEIYKMEVRNKMPSTLKYPYFRDLHWFAARGLCTELSEYINTGVPPPLYLVRGLKTLLATLRIWLRETSVTKLKVHNPPELFRDLSKEIRRAERLLLQANPPKPERESKRIKRKPAFDDYIIDFSDLKKNKLVKKEYGNLEQEGEARLDMFTSRTSNEDLKAEGSPGCSRDAAKGARSPNYGNWKRIKCGELKVVLTKTLIKNQISRDESVYDFVDEEAEQISTRFYSDRPSTSSPQNHATANSITTPEGVSEVNQKHDGHTDLEISNMR
uniref:JmjC domain-containing protein n=1 Tax=Rhodnius prolixus TaxID=13249 RepID=A0ABL0EK04_RHOPR